MTKNDLFEFFSYLDMLFHSRLVDMGRSTPYLEMRFNLDRRTAKEVVSKWIDCDPHEALKNRIKKALA